MTKKTDDEVPLIDGDMVCGLPTPNINFPFAIEEDTDDEIVKARQRYRWPLTMARRYTEPDENLPHTIGLFVDPIHNEVDYYRWADHPPTWMDPHLLIVLAKDDPAVQKVLAEAIKANDGTAWKRLEPLLVSLYDKLYAPFVRSQFLQHAAPMLAAWLLNHEADAEVGRRNAAKLRRRKPAE